MNLMLGLLTGLLVGWVTFRMLGTEPRLSRRTALLAGSFAAGIAAEFQPIFDASGTGGALSIAGIAFAAVVAGGSILLLNMAARRYGHE